MYRQKPIYQGSMLKLDNSSTEAVSVKNYEIRISKSNYTHIQVYLCRVYFLTILDIYKNYFKGHFSVVIVDANKIHAYCNRKQKLP